MVNSCLRQLGREPVGLPHHCRAANDVRVINILPIRQQEKFLNDRCPEIKVNVGHRGHAGFFHE
jgi:hypothetical protein